MPEKQTKFIYQLNCSPELNLNVFGYFFQKPRLLLDEESSPSVMSTATSSDCSSNSSGEQSDQEKNEIWMKKKVTEFFFQLDKARDCSSLLNSKRICGV